MRRSPAALSLPLLALALAACTGDSPKAVSSASTSVPLTDVGPIEWEDFGDESNVQTGSIIVPIDYDDPS